MCIGVVIGVWILVILYLKSLSPFAQETRDINTIWRRAAKSLRVSPNQLTLEEFNAYIRTHIKNVDGVLYIEWRSWGKLRGIVVDGEGYKILSQASDSIAKYVPKEDEDATA